MVTARSRAKTQMWIFVRAAMAGTLPCIGSIRAGLTWTCRVVVASVFLINAQYVSSCLSLACPTDLVARQHLGDELC